MTYEFLPRDQTSFYQTLTVGNEILVKTPKTTSTSSDLKMGFIDAHALRFE